MKTLHFDPRKLPSLKLKRQKIAAAELTLFSKYEFKNWNGEPFDANTLSRHGEWVCSDDRRVIFLSLGGGTFEIPEMYDLIVDEAKVRIWCGGGGGQAKRYDKKPDGSDEISVLVSQIWIPRLPSQSQETVLELVVDAFAASCLNDSNMTLTVKFEQIITA